MLPVFCTSRSDRRPLRIGLLLDRESLSGAFAAVVNDIKSSDFATIDLLVLHKNPEAAAVAQARATLSKIYRRLANPSSRRLLLFDLYQGIDRKFAPEDDPLAEVDCRDRFQGIERIEVEPIKKGFVHRFPPEIVEEIRKKDLDVLLRFGFNILRGNILQAARYGVWSYHHGDNDYYRGGPAHFWELVEGSPTSGVILQVLTEELDGGLVLCKGLYPTEPTLFLSQNRKAPFWGAASFVIWKLNELHQLGWDEVKARALPPTPYRGKKKIYRSPTNLEMLSWLAPIIPRKLLKRASRRDLQWHWRLALRNDSATSLIEQEGPESLQAFRWIESPRGHSWADPWLLMQQDQIWLFFEDFRYCDNRGVISCAEVNPDGSLGPVQTALDTGTHLSYPAVFEHEGQVYMVPECSHTKAVPLFRATRFPNQWTFEGNLLEGQSLVDTTLLYEGGMWWMFTTELEPTGCAVTLLLLYAESLAGPWAYHPANPISKDVRYARNAGRIFRSSNRLFRMSQDCARCYGYSFTANEILTLSCTEYQEKAFKTIEPSWSPGLIGTHSYARAGLIEAIDGYVIDVRSRFT